MLETDEQDKDIRGKNIISNKTNFPLPYSHISQLPFTKYSSTKSYRDTPSMLLQELLPIH